VLEHLPLNNGDPSSVGGYHLVGRLAAGGQGVVFLGYGHDGKPVAVKLLHPPSLGGDQKRDGLQREVDAARRVAPFCTAQILDARLTDDPPYIVSEFVDGPPLSRSIAERGPLTGTALDRLAIATATALVAIHRAGVVHRDLKPANILLGPDGARVIDFGVARPMDAQTTQTGALRGTPSYMAPEQFAGRRATAASDMFAWAATMIYAATGRSAFAADSMVATAYRISAGDFDLAGVPAHLAPLLRRCLAVEPGDRPTAAQVLVALLGHPTNAAATGSGDEGRVFAAAAQALAAAPTSDSPDRGESGGPTLPVPRRRRRRMAAAALAGALVVAAAVVGGRLLTTGQGQAVAGGSGGAAAAGAVESRPATNGAPAGAAGTTDALAPTTGGSAPASGPGRKGTAPPGSPQATGSGQSSPAASSAKSARSATTGASAGTVDPADLVGTWAGPVQHWSTTGVRLTLTGSGRTGTIAWDGLNCPSNVTLASSAGNTFTYKLAIQPVHDDICTTAGWLKATVDGATMSGYWWEEGNSGNNLVSTLTRQG
jgi:hypothetical protein